MGGHFSSPELKTAMQNPRPFPNRSFPEILGKIHPVMAIVAALTFGALQPAQAQEFVSRSELGAWLRDYIPAQYPGTIIDDHEHWWQAQVSADLVVSWSALHATHAPLGHVEGVYVGKSLFIDQLDEKTWAGVAGAEFHENAGYYVTGYAPASMGDWAVADLTVVQFDGDSQAFVTDMTRSWRNARAATSDVMPMNVFSTWLGHYLAAQFPGLKVDDNVDWYQAHLPVGLVVSWAPLPDPAVTLGEITGLDQGEPFFVATRNQESWGEHPAVIPYNGAGYFVSGYDAATMADWVVGHTSLAQLRGDAKRFAHAMALAWINANRR